MKLIYATDFDSTNIVNWSGLGYYYGVMLKNAGFELDYVNNLVPAFPFLHRFKQKVIERTTGLYYLHRYNVQNSKRYAQIIQKKVKPGFPIFSSHPVVLAHLDGNNKRILYNDATFDCLVNLYPKFKRMTRQTKIDGHENETKTIQNCELLIYSSQWAANSAIQKYNADPGKVFVIPYGANLRKVPTYNDIKSIIHKRLSTNEINIIFPGVEWIRKGGDKALEVIKKLNELGLNATLHIVGINDDIADLERHKVIKHGFIWKGNNSGEDNLAAIYSKCHFLLLPTIADCTPVVFSEAAAYGLPCITTNVGGNSFIVSNDVTGKVFELSNFTDNAVQYILNLINSPMEYEQLCLSSYDRYCTELNWEATGRKIYKLISNL
jgi:glycosyltransferase involved in cell wall biosynthesis